MSNGQVVWAVNYISRELLETNQPPSSHSPAQKLLLDSPRLCRYWQIFSGKGPDSKWVRFCGPDISIALQAALDKM